MLPEARVAEPVTEREVVRLAREIYGLNVSAQTLPSEYDDNFQITTRDGQSFVLKVMCAARERAFVEMQCAAIEHMSSRTPHLNLQRVYPTRSGAAFESAKIADGGERLVWMLTYLPGTVLAEARPYPPELLESLGCLLGEI